MRFALVAPAAIVASLLIGTGDVHAQAPAAAAPAGETAGLIVIDSARPFAETGRRLVEAVETAGLTVAARIDHEANARSVGLQLPPTVLVLFGNRKPGRF